MRFAQCVAIWFFFAAPFPCTAITRVWIDTDAAIGAPWREVDDAFALVLAFNSPELEIIGISSSYGNAPLPRTTVVAQNLVRRFSRLSIAVHPGAANAADLGRRTDATEALANVLRQTGDLTYIALGPLTNLATFEALHPDLAKRITRVLFVGGQSSSESLRLGRGGRLKIHDANVFKDPAAVAQILRSNLRLVLTPAEVGARLLVRPEDRQEPAPAGAAARFLNRQSTAWFWYWRNIAQADGGPIFDALPVLAAALPARVRTRLGFAKLQDRELIYSFDRTPAARPVTIAFDVDETARRAVLDRLKK